MGIFYSAGNRYKKDREKALALREACKCRRAGACILYGRQGQRWAVEQAGCTEDDTLPCSSVPVQGNATVHLLVHLES